MSMLGKNDIVHDEATAQRVTDYFEDAADRILSGATKRKVQPRPEPDPVFDVETKRPGVKRAIRKAVDRGMVEVFGPPVLIDDVNTITNRVFKRAVRPLLAQVFADGVEAGRDDLAACCGCSGSGVHNPYNGSEI